MILQVIKKLPYTLQNQIINDKVSSTSKQISEKEEPVSMKPFQSQKEFFSVPWLRH